MDDLYVSAGLLIVDLGLIDSMQDILLEGQFALRDLLDALTEQVEGCLSVREGFHPDGLDDGIEAFDGIGIEELGEGDGGSLD